MKQIDLWCAATLLLPIPVLANTIVNADLTVKVNDPCRAQVSKFEQTIGFIRQSQGVQAAADLKERLLPAKLENELLFKEGYCGLAKHLKEKRLL